MDRMLIRQRILSSNSSHVKDYRQMAFSQKKCTRRGHIDATNHDEIRKTFIVEFHSSYLTVCNAIWDQIANFRLFDADAQITQKVNKFETSEMFINK